jgi:RimJ/RimL family protein N-acetyltransferase
LEELEDFFRRVPEDERDIFKADVCDRATLTEWKRQDVPKLVIVKNDDDTIVGTFAVMQDQGWSSHVGKVLVLVDSEFRGRGLGRDLTRRALMTALDLGLRKIVAELLPEQQAAIDMFTDLGFYPEALLRAHVRDRKGKLHDLVLLSHEVDENWEVLGATGILDAVGS